MLESGYQKKIFDKFFEVGGWAVNGKYSKDGEADLQCGYPWHNAAMTPMTDLVPSSMDQTDMSIRLTEVIMLHIAVEVKTEKDYHRVMRCIEIVDGLYKIVNHKGLKKHEPLQIAKINMLRGRGGLALVAWNFEQVEEYVNGRFS